jgi:SpoVK/Ycf46/Vps4 family AAA+-type ATPase
MMTALDSIFNSNQETLFGDIFHGRHGGIVVLANGPSGVGKTLTAEVFAEFQKRPLYSMEMSEIGTSVKEVEANLQRIFARAKKWNAVLLFDEADIFLSERVASDLERSAIVGIFLRLLDYYEGTFFLTTNRGDGIDKAFRSRVTLYLNYPELSPQTRKTIWQSMIAAAGLNVTEDNVSWDDISEEGLNGRQVRNQVRLLKLMYPDNQLKTSDIISSLEFTAR